MWNPENGISQIINPCRSKCRQRLDERATIPDSVVMPFQVFCPWAGIVQQKQIVLLHVRGGQLCAIYPVWALANVIRLGEAIGI